jgi:hypothetical protein
MVCLIQMLYVHQRIDAIRLRAYASSLVTRVIGSKLIFVCMRYAYIVCHKRMITKLYV